MLPILWLLSLAPLPSAWAVSIGGCENYIPLQGDVVECRPDITPVASQGVIAPERNTTNNDISVTVQAGTFLDINGSTIGLGSGSIVVNDGRLNTQKFTNGYGISAGVNSRSQLGGSSITNNGEITTEGSNAHGIIISAERVTGGAGNTIINNGSIQTLGTGDGIRLFTTARGVNNQITNTGSIETAAKVAGIRLRSSESTDTISNTGTITMSGENAWGIAVFNTLNRPVVNNSGTITTTGVEGYAIYGDGALEFTNTGTLAANTYAVYFEDGTRSAGSNTVIIKSGSDITGGLKFNASKTAETLVFDSFVDADFDNVIVNINNLSAIQAADVTMSATSYSFGVSQINVDETAKLVIAAPIGDGAVVTAITKTGAGVLTLSNANSYTGGLEISAGTVALGNSSSAGSGLIKINDGAVLQAAGASLSVANTIELTSGFGTIDASGFDLNVASAISGAGNLIKDGAGTLALSGQSAFTGSTTINAGILQANVADALPSNTAVTINAGTLALNNVNQTIGSLAGAGAVTLGTGTLTLGGDGSDTVYSGAISGAGGLTKDGTGAMTLAGLNTFSGATTISAGSLLAGSIDTLSADSAITIASGAQLDLNGFDQSIGSLSGQGNTLLGAATLTTGSDDTSTTYSGSISGAGGLIKEGIGIFTVAGSNTNTGEVAVYGGTIRLGIADAFVPIALAVNTVGDFDIGGTFDLNNFNQTVTGLAGAGSVTLGSGTLTVNSAANSDFAGDISGTGNLIKDGVGTLALSGQSAYTGSTTINAGILQANVADALPSNTAVTINAGTLALNNVNQTIGSLAGAGAVTLGTGTLTVGGDDTDTSYSGIIAGTGGLSKDGTGTFTLSGENTYTGATSILAGTLATEGDNRLADSLEVTVASGATFLLGGSQTAAAISGDGTINLGEYRLTTGAQNSTFSGLITGGAGGITHDGPGTLILAGTTDFLGDLIINSGEVDLTNADSVRSDKIIELNAGGTLIVEKRTVIGFLRQNGGTLTGGGELVASLIETQSGPLNAIIVDDVEFKVGLVKVTDGLTTVGAPHEFTGIIKVQDGTLRLATSSTEYSVGGSFAAQSSVLMSGSGVLDLNGKHQTFSFVSGTSGTIAMGSGSLTVSGTEDATYSGIITGSGDLIKNGKSVWTLAGVNTFTGNTTVQGGTLKLGIANAVAPTALTVTTGATFDLNNFNQTVTGLAGAGSVTLGSGTLMVNSAANSDFAGDISGTGGLTKDGVGTLALSGQSAYTGSTTINAGILQANVADALPSNTAVTINAGTLALNNVNQTIGSLAGAGAVTLGTGTLTLGGDGSDTVYSGAISGAGGLTKDGTGTFTLLGQNTYTGDTTVNGGTLKLGVANAVAQTALTVNTGGTFDLNNFDQTVTGLAGAGSVTLGSGTLRVNSAANSDFAGDISGTGGLTKDGVGTLALSGQSAYTGSTTINAGILQANVADALPSNTAVTINAGTLALNNVNQTIGSLAGAGAVTLGTGTLTVGGDDTDTSYSGIISGTGSLTKVGVGSLTLSNANTYSGGTVLSQGVLVVANDNALGTGSLETAQDTIVRAGKANLTLANAVMVQGDTTIDTAGELVLLTGSVSGAGRLIKVGAGTLELAGENTYSGGTQIEQGVLALDVNAAASTGEVVMGAGTTLQADASLSINNLIKLRGEVEVNTQSFDLTLNNAVINNSVGVLVKTGAGTLTMNGVNTYSGGTTIVDGTLALFGRLASGVQVGTGARLGGTGTINGDVINRGLIQPRLNGARSTLTIEGNYRGDNGVFASTLEGTAPAAIVADQLAIVGAGATASGNTTIAISDPSSVLGQPTVGDGILLVSFSDGAMGASTAFRSDRIAAGAYEYQLVRGGQSSAEDWFLRADDNAPAPPVPVTPEAAQRQEVALYPALPALARQYLMNINGTLDERRGAPDGLPKERVAWARVIAQRNETMPPNVNDGPGFKTNDWGLQLGADLVRADLQDGHWRMGPVLTIGRSTGQAYNNSGSIHTGGISLSGYSLGLNATLAMDNGAYLDVLVQGTRLTGLSANSPLGTSIQTKGWGVSGSVEGGWRLGLSDTVSLTPQAQLYGIHTQLDNSGDLFSRIEMAHASTLVGRVGLKLAYDNLTAEGPRTQLWARLSALSTLSGRDASTTFLNVAGTNPTTFQSRAPASWMSLDVGLTVHATPNTQLYVGLGYQTSFNGQYRGASAQVNVRVGF